MYAPSFLDRRKVPPTLLIHGENDNDVPVAESEQYYIALRDVGVQAIMVHIHAKVTVSGSRNT